MRAKHIILFLLTAWALSGCTWVRESWPWRKKNVPITRPTMVAPAPDDAAGETRPATEPPQPEGEPAPPLAPAPEVTKPEAQAVTPPEAQTEPSPPATAPAPEARPAEPRTDLRPLPKFPPPVEPSPPAADAERPHPPEPPLPRTTSVRIVKPTMLENLVPGAKPIPGVETPPTAQSEPPEPAPRPPVAVPKPPDTTVPPPERPRLPVAPPEVRPVRRVALPAPTPRAPVEPEVPPPPPKKIKLPIELPPPRPAPSPPAPEKIIYGKPEVVAASSIQVNDRFLTVDDVLSSARDRMLRVPRGISQDTFRLEVARILRNEISRQVQESLVHAEAEKHLTDQQKKMIEDDLRETLATMIAEVGGSRKKLDSLLAERGTDLATVLDQERRRMMVLRFLQFRFSPAITVNRRMLWNYYRKHLSEFSFPKRVQMQIIARRYPKVAGGRVGPTRAERRLAAARARLVIHDAIEALRSGEEFAETARRFSNGIKAAGGGIWPMMATGNFRETAVEQAAFAMDEGQVSSVIETGTGYYIVKALKVRPGRTIRFEDAQEQVERQLRKEQSAKLQKAYFRRLAEGAHIRQSEEFLKLAVDRAVKQYWRE